MTPTRLGRFETFGEADPARTRRAGWADAVVALVVALLAWPFPLARASLSWPVHVALLLAAMLAADMAIRAVSIAAWRRTVAMYLFDLGLAETAAPQGPGRRLAWGPAWTLVLVPSLMGARRLVHPSAGLPARLSGLETRSTRPPVRDGGE